MNWDLFTGCLSLFFAHTSPTAWHGWLRLGYMALALVMFTRWATGVL